MEQLKTNNIDDNNAKRQAGRIVSGAYYDMQEVRKASKNRLRDVIRKRLEGIPFDAVEEKKEEQDVSYGAYSDEEILRLLKEAEKKGDIGEDELKYIKRCIDLSNKSESLENSYRTAMLHYVKSEPIYTVFLEQVRGIGPVLAANLIKEFGYCERYDTVSKLWAHTGNGVSGGVAPKKRKGEDISFSPSLRTLTWKISDCLMKSNKGVYRNVYDTEKARQLDGSSGLYSAGVLFSRYGAPYTESDVRVSKLHAHNRALRKMRKLFLSHFWAASRELVGLDVRKPFVEEHLGHKNIISWRSALSRESSFGGVSEKEE